MLQTLNQGQHTAHGFYLVVREVDALEMESTFVEVLVDVYWSAVVLLAMVLVDSLHVLESW